MWDYRLTYFAMESIVLEASVHEYQLVTQMVEDNNGKVENDRSDLVVACLHTIQRDGQVSYKGGRPQ